MNLSLNEAINVLFWAVYKRIAIAKNLESYVKKTWIRCMIWIATKIPTSCYLGYAPVLQKEYCYVHNDKFMSNLADNRQRDRRQINRQMFSIAPTPSVEVELNSFPQYMLLLILEHL